MSRIKKETKSSNEANYTLYDQKLTFDFLKGHLWKAADILRGSLDPSEYRQPEMTALFLKRLNDNFEEQAEKLISISSVRVLTATKGYSLRARLPAYSEFLSNTAFISDKLRLYIESLFDGYGLVQEGYLL